MAKRIIAPGGEHVSWQLQYRKCGKFHCRTCEGKKGHGPYWYAYWRKKDDGRVTSVYVGKKLPPEVAQQLEGASKGHEQSQQALTSCVLPEEPEAQMQSALPTQLRCGA